MTPIIRGLSHRGGTVIPRPSTHKRLHLGNVNDSPFRGYTPTSCQIRDEARRFADKFLGKQVTGKEARGSSYDLTLWLTNRVATPIPEPVNPFNRHAYATAQVAPS